MVCTRSHEQITVPRDRPTCSASVTFGKLLDIPNSKPRARRLAQAEPITKPKMTVRLESCSLADRQTLCGFALVILSQAMARMPAVNVSQVRKICAINDTWPVNT